MAKIVQRVFLKPTGIFNKNNDCFLISALQPLFLNWKFTTFLASQEKNEKLATKCLFELFKTYKNSDVKLENFIRNLSQKIYLFDGEMQDSHEFLITFLNMLLEEHITEPKRLDESFLNEINRSEMAKFFLGFFKYRIKFLSCSHESTRYELSTIITIHISDTVQRAINEITNTKRLVGNEQIQCSRCKEVKDGVQKMELLHIPNILILHISRFINMYQKDMRDITINEIVTVGSTKYYLYSIISHSGNLRYGHYISHVKTNGKWYLLDDSQIREDSPNLSSSDGYILFYSRTIL